MQRSAPQLRATPIFTPNHHLINLKARGTTLYLQTIPNLLFHLMAFLSERACARGIILRAHSSRPAQRAGNGTKKEFLIDGVGDTPA